MDENKIASFELLFLGIVLITLWAFHVIFFALNFQMMLLVLIISCVLSLACFTLIRNLPNFLPKDLAIIDGLSIMLVFLPGIILWTSWFLSPYFIPKETPARFAEGLMLVPFIGCTLSLGCFAVVVTLLSNVSLKLKLVSVIINLSFLIYLIILILIL